MCYLIRTDSFILQSIKPIVGCAAVRGLKGKKTRTLAYHDFDLPARLATFSEAFSYLLFTDVFIQSGIIEPIQCAILIDLHHVTNQLEVPNQQIRVVPGASEVIQRTFRCPYMHKVEYSSSMIFALRSLIILDM